MIRRMARGSEERFQVAKILVTGGAGYIGSHVCVELMAKGFDVVVLDDLRNSHPESLSRIARIAGRGLDFVQGDVRDRALLERLFADHDIAGAVHMAGLKAVGESTENPWLYYDVNLGGAIALVDAMGAAGCRALIFSSSATVYGEPERTPLDEDCARRAMNPYGRSKLMIEQMIEDLAASDASWRLMNLRYFNPVGAHESGLIGEDPNGIPNNLFPFIAQVAVGAREALGVFGDDYETPDGTGVRDYIHVVDLARGHVAALEYLMGLATGPGQALAVNLGTGQPYSVMECLAAWNRTTGRDLPYRILPRRPGDIACCYANPGLAKDMLGWQAEYDLTRMCADHWRWQSRNPQGYRNALAG